MLVTVAVVLWLVAVNTMGECFQWLHCAKIIDFIMRVSMTLWLCIVSLLLEPFLSSLLEFLEFVVICAAEFEHSLSRRLLIIKCIRSTVAMPW